MGGKHFGEEGTGNCDRPVGAMTLLELRSLQCQESHDSYFDGRPLIASSSNKSTGLDEDAAEDQVYKIAFCFQHIFCIPPSGFKKLQSEYKPVLLVLEVAVVDNGHCGK